MEPTATSGFIATRVDKSLQRTMIRLDPYFQLREKHGKRFARKKRVEVLES